MSDPLDQEWQRLVKRSQADAAAPPPPPPPLPPDLRPRRRWRLPLAFLLSLGALVLWWKGPLNPWPQAPTPQEIEAGQMASVMLALRAIHDYAAFHGRYPATIEEVMPLAFEIRYTLTADGFELRVESATGGEPIVVRGN